MAQPTLDFARSVLNRYFGYPDFRPAQLPAVEAVLSRRDAVIVLPTGGGKSICFQVPALCFRRLSVVVSPLISLMADQVQALEKRGISATFLNSTLPPDETNRRVDLLRRGDVKLLYVAPERLAVGSMSTLLAQVGVDMLAVDEAHCVSEWGQDFRPSYLRLATLRRVIGNPQTVALTATATPRVRRDIARLLELNDPIVIVGGFDRPNLTFRVATVGSDAERHQAMITKMRSCTDPAVVYAATRRQVELVARILSSGRVNAVAYHAGLAPDRRAKTQDAFMSGSAQVIVATNAFGMGIDKPNVRLVLHYLHSGSLEDYYQEAGRAGRDGARSHCLLLFNAADRFVHDRMRERGFVPDGVLRSVWESMASLSGGRRPVPMDQGLLAARIGQPRELIANALAILEQRGLFTEVTRPAVARVRLLASPLRLQCELASLNGKTRMMLEHISAADCAPDEWRAVRRIETGLQPHRFQEVLSELESRQLIFVDPAPARAIVGSDARGRSQISKLIHQLKTRREIERAKLNSMVGYATTFMCRRRFILSYFGDQSGDDKGCGDCDVCEPAKQIR
jgi:ATP-dependent DNA helicase RecQ